MTIGTVYYGAFTSLAGGQMRFFLRVLFLFSCVPVWAQTNSYDIYRFTAPKDWQPSNAANYVSYLSATNTMYCQIALYKSTAGSNNPTQDFLHDWKELVSNTFTVIGEFKYETVDVHGWKMTMGAARVTSPGSGNFVSLLSTYTRDGVKASILVNYNDDSYKPAFEKFLSSVSLTAPVRAGAPGQNTAPPIARNTPLDPSMLVGEWVRVEQFIPGSYTTVRPTNTYRYTFNADGSYEYKKPPAALVEVGHYKVKGDHIEFQPHERISKKRLASYAIQWFYGQHPQYTSESNFGLQLHDKSSGWVTYKKTVPLSSAAPATAEATGKPTTLVGKWKRTIAALTDFTNPASTITYQGYSRFNYEFRPDHTYTFDQEVWFGHLRNEYLVVQESGTYAVDSDRIDLVPQKNSWVLREKRKDGPVKKQGSNSLEKMSYRWGFYYWPGTQEWNFYLQADKATQRDGGFDTSGKIANAYYFKPNDR